MSLSKKSITATSESYSNEYDGTEQSSDDSTFSIDIPGFDIEVTSKSTITNVSENGKKNSFVIRVFKDSVDVTDNFIISYEPGEMALEQKEVTLKTSEIIIPYNYSVNSVESYIKSQLVFDANVSINDLTVTKVAGDNNTVTLGENSNYKIGSNNNYSVIYETLVSFDNTMFEYGDSVVISLTNYSCKNANNTNIDITYTGGTDDLLVGNYDLSDLYTSTSSSYSLIFNQSLVINKCTLYVRWKNIEDTNDTNKYQITDEDCEVTTSDGTYFSDYGVYGEEIIKPNSPFGSSVSYCGSITILNNPECYNIVYIPGVITFN